MMKIVYTMGHSNGTVEHLLEMLDRHGIKAVGDGVEIEHIFIEHIFIDAHLSGF